ncbi:histidine kinase [bacterium]|nr:histidine kinase [bacterium]
MKNIKLIVILLLLITKLPAISDYFDEKLKVFGHDDIQFFIGNIPKFNETSPDFTQIPNTAWKDFEQYRTTKINGVTKVWFKIDLSGLIIPFNAIYFHSLKNNLRVYYPEQIFPTKATEASISNYDVNSHVNKQIIILKSNPDLTEFPLNMIYFSIDIDQKTPLFKFFPVVVGDEATIREYIINEEVIKRNNDYLTFFAGNFLLFVSLITLITFIITIRRFNYTMLFFSLVMATSGLLYWMLSPLSLFFSDFTYTRMLYILTFFHLVWFFFGLLISSFLKKKYLAIISLLVLINLILVFIAPKTISQTRFLILIILAIFNLIIILQINKSKLDLLQTNFLFSIAAMFNFIFLISPIFLSKQGSINMFSKIGMGLFVWIIAFAVYAYRHYNMTVNELQAQKIKNLELTESNLESQLSSLKKQLDPHFLFNSLGTLVALIEIDKECAIDYIQEFSKVYRYILDTKDNNFVTVAEELNFCHAFVFLLKKRFNESIVTSFNIEKQNLQKQVPPLSIQMLIENAIKHNIATDESPLEINIYTQDDYVIVENLLQLKKHNQPTSKLGLKNLNQRLYLLKQINIVIVESSKKFIAKIPLLSEV